MRWTSWLLPLGVTAALLGASGFTLFTGGVVLALVVLFLSSFLVSLVALTVGMRRAAAAPDTSPLTIDGAPATARSSRSD